MNSLAQLVAAAQAAVEAKAQAKAAKKLVKTTSGAAQANAIAESLRLQAELDWRPYAVVLRVDRWGCLACGEEGEAPLGFFLLQSHRTLANSYRFLPLKAESTQDLPRRLRVEPRSVGACQHCAAERGFTPLPARVAPPVVGTFVREWQARTAPLPERPISTQEPAKCAQPQV